MATAAADGRVLDPTPASSWEYVEHSALKLSRNCLGVKNAGGLILIAGTLFVFSFPFRLVA